MGGVDRRRHGDDDKVGAGEAARIVGAFELCGRLEVFGGDLTRRIAELAIGRDLGLRKIVADGPELLAEFHRQRQAHVAETDDGDGRVIVQHLK